jgi:histidinol dehydrogenase
MTTALPLLSIARYPNRSSWEDLIRRPAVNDPELPKIVSQILEGVRTGGDAAVADFSKRFDGAVPPQVRLRPEDLKRASASVSRDLRVALEQAIANITAFHKSQRVEECTVETQPGVVCFRRAVPIERVGIYIPAGTAPLFSTLIMLAVPAKIAGCREIVLASPGGRDARIDPVIALCAVMLEIDEVYLMGGAQAIAALAYGTELVRPVQKICGPGNRFVNEAKLQVASRGVGIDMPAGPSEVLVIADEAARPRFIAADLLAQAEHGPDSQVVVVTTSEQVLKGVIEELGAQLQSLPRSDVAAAALAFSRAIVVRDLDEAIDFSNLYAPEHLILSVENPERLVNRVINAGSVFLGAWSPEALGDYASGTNHVLPTNRAAVCFSGVSVDSFTKKITFQQITPEGLRRLAPCVTTMARAEGLEAHARAVEVRQEVLI